jgi:hypothetical protein
MLGIKKKVLYEAFNLKIVSDYPLPELHVLGSEIDKGEYDVKIETITNQLDELVLEPYEFSIMNNKVKFYVPDTAFFTMENGNKITVATIPGYDEDLIRIYILGTCMGVILLQKKIIPLHGSALVIDGKAYAFVGDSGAGKSTLASAFMKKGYKLLSDDVIGIYFSSLNIPMVVPSYPQQKLWQESLTQFGMSSNGLKPIFDRETKFAVPIQSNFHAETIPLVGVFELVKTDVFEPSVHTVKGLDQLKILNRHTYRNFLIPMLNLNEWHFTTSVKLVNEINMYQISRPKEGFSAYKLVSLILSTLN